MLTGVPLSTASPQIRIAFVTSEHSGGVGYLPVQVLWYKPFTVLRDRATAKLCWYSSTLPCAQAASWLWVALCLFSTVTDLSRLNRLPSNKAEINKDIILSRTGCFSIHRLPAAHCSALCSLHNVVHITSIFSCFALFVQQVGCGCCSLCTFPVVLQCLIIQLMNQSRSHSNQSVGHSLFICSWVPPVFHHRLGCCRSGEPGCCTSIPPDRRRCTCRYSRVSCCWQTAGPLWLAASSAQLLSGRDGCSADTKRNSFHILGIKLTVIETVICNEITETCNHIIQKSWE